MTAIEALMARIRALEKDFARTRAENNELREHVNTLQTCAFGGSSPVDTKLLSVPTEFEAKEEDWNRFSLKMKAYLGAIDPRYNEFLLIAEDPERSVSHDDLGSGNDRRDGQLLFVLWMLLKDRAMDKVELADTNCGLQLWRKLTQEYEPKWKSRHLSRHQATLNFKFLDNIMAELDQFEREVRQYHAITGKHIDEDTMSGVILGALAKSSNEIHRDLTNHLVLNAYRLDSSNKILVEIRDIFSTMMYMNQESAISAVSKTKVERKGGKGKKGMMGDSKVQVTIKFAGSSWVCEKSGHKQRD